MTSFMESMQCLGDQMQGRDDRMWDSGIIAPSCSFSKLYFIFHSTAKLCPDVIIVLTACFLELIRVGYTANEY